MPFLPFIHQTKCYNMENDSLKVQWEMFCDDAYFGMFAVRPVGDRDYNSGRLFHFENEHQASAFLVLIRQAHCAVLED